MSLSPLSSPFSLSPLPSLSLSPLPSLSLLSLFSPLFLSSLLSLLFHLLPSSLLPSSLLPSSLPLLPLPLLPLLFSPNNCDVCIVTFANGQLHPSSLSAPKFSLYQKSNDRTKRKKLIVSLAPTVLASFPGPPDWERGCHCAAKM